MQNALYGNLRLNVARILRRAVFRLFMEIIGPDGIGTLTATREKLAMRAARIAVSVEWS